MHLAVLEEEKMFYKGDNMVQELAKAADEATQREHRMSTWQALPEILEGVLMGVFNFPEYHNGRVDLTVCGNLIAIPAFQRQYGFEYNPVNDPGAYIIPGLLAGRYYARYRHCSSCGRCLGRSNGRSFQQEAANLRVLGW